MTGIGVLILIVLHGLILGGFTGFVANQKGYSMLAWFGLGFFFSLIALLAATGLPKKGQAS